MSIKKCDGICIIFQMTLYNINYSPALSHSLVLDFKCSIISSFRTEVGKNNRIVVWLWLTKWWKSRNKHLCLHILLQTTSAHMHFTTHKTENSSGKNRQSFKKESEIKNNGDYTIWTDLWPLIWLTDLISNMTVVY